MKTLLIVMAACVLASCGGYNTGTIQRSEKGFLKFTGRTEQVKITVDEIEVPATENKEAVYQVKPGKHAVKAFRNDHMIVDRLVIVDDQATMEVEIP